MNFIKDALYVIAYYLTFIINTSIVTGVFPTPWKHALVIPVFKKGDVRDQANYRPISLLPIISKVLEKVFTNQLTQFLESNKLLSTFQHGFRPKLSAETALTYVTDKIYQNMDSKKVTVLTLCDLSKAFDSVSHQILLLKCSDLNIDNFWFNNYLQNRTQSVRLNNILSNEMNITCGVSQGSILGPILFSIYVNDISKHLEQCHIIQYADDTQFFHSGPVHKFQEDFVKPKKHYLTENIIFKEMV